VVLDFGAVCAGSDDFQIWGVVIGFERWNNRWWHGRRKE